MAAEPSWLCQLMTPETTSSLTSLVCLYARLSRAPHQIKICRILVSDELFARAVQHSCLMVTHSLASAADCVNLGKARHANSRAPAWLFSNFDSMGNPSSRI